MSGNNEDYRVTLDLIDSVQEVGRELLAMEHNAIFVTEHGPGTIERELCAAIIDEAKKIVAMGYNAKFGCSDIDLLRGANYAQKYRDKAKGAVDG